MKATHWLAKLYAVLQGADEVRVRELDDLEGVVLFHVADPLVGLALGVDQQRPPGCVAV